MPTVHARTLRRAAEIVGGVEELAAQLDVPSGDIAEWTQGTKPVPQEVFLRAVDIVTAHQVNEISGKHPTIKAAPSTNQ
jgi:hypothetical protein